MTGYCQESFRAILDIILTFLRDTVGTFNIIKIKSLSAREILLLILQVTELFFAWAFFS